MITGVVTPAREAVFSLALSAPGGDMLEIEAVIDTGFDGFLTLPSDLIQRLALPLLGRVRAALGDGSEIGMAGFEARVAWDGSEREALVLEADGVPLVGMAMMLGCRLTIDVEPDGFVRIESLPPQHAVPAN